jgi:hypothetical protein
MQDNSYQREIIPAANDISGILSEESNFKFLDGMIFATVGFLGGLFVMGTEEGATYGLMATLGTYVTTRVLDQVRSRREYFKNNEIDNQINNY